MAGCTWGSWCNGDASLMYLVGIVIILVLVSKFLRRRNSSSSSSSSKKYEDEEEEEPEEEEEEETQKCERCGKIIPEDDDYFDCDECGDEPLCNKCIVEFDTCNICKKCIDTKYPGRERIVEKEKIVYRERENTRRREKKGKQDSQEYREPVEPIFEDSSEFD